MNSDLIFAAGYRIGICGEHTMRGYPHPDKLLEQIREKNLSSFEVPITELKLLPITEVVNEYSFFIRRANGTPLRADEFSFDYDYPAQDKLGKGSRALVLQIKKQ